jgi:glycosyltransferase involved in cell wall biosynthesis
MQVPPGLDWELIVVDNNSRDHTAQVCEEFAGRLPMRYLQEKRQGHTLARNCGIAEARGDIIAFTDDDVEVDNSWLEELSRAAKSHPEAGFFGGKILPLWEKTPPLWMIEHSKGSLSGITMYFSMGEEVILVEKAHPVYNSVFFGANMAFRKHAVEKLGPFRPDLGMRGSSLGFHDETEYMQRLLGAGYRGMYAPGMIVHHRNPPQRITERYIFRYFSSSGACDVRLGRIRRSGKMLFGASMDLWRLLAANTGLYLIRRWKPWGSATWVSPAISMAMMWGAIVEMRNIPADCKNQEPAPKH